MFIWDPREKKQGERRNSLVQGIDIPVTVLDVFGIEPTKDMLGKNLRPVIQRDQAVRSYALFGMHGAQVNITDGRYVYMREPLEGNDLLYNYTQMPTHMRCLFSVDEMKTAKLHPGFSFTKGTPVLKISAMKDTSGDTSMKKSLGTVLYDLEKDPKQQHPMEDPKVENRMIRNMVQLMKENDAPEEQYQRLGLTFIN